MVKTLFLGTPETAVPFLKNLFEKTQVVGVVTQPDRPAKRGQVLQKSPVKILAEERGVPVLQPINLKDGTLSAQIQELKPDVGIVVAYGRILPKDIISLFPKGIYNIHFSLLPELRGAAPIQWAILRGHPKTGVCSFKIAETLDTGEIMSRREVPLAEDETAVTLENKLVALGLETLKETLQKVSQGVLNGAAQQGPSSYAPLLKKEDAQIHWSAPAEDIGRKIRGLVRMGAFCLTPEGETLKITAARPLAGSGSGDSGAFIKIDGREGFVVKCGSGSLLVTRVQPQGKKEMEAWAFLQGHPLKPGDKFN